MLFCFFALISTASAQGIIIDVPGSAEVPLAIPKPAKVSGATQKAVNSAWEALRKDAEMSGYFELQDPGASLDKNPGLAPGDFPFDPWRLTETSVLIKSRIYGKGSPECDGADRICADAYIYYVPTGETLASKRVSAPSAQPRHLGHGIARELLAAAIGVDSWFGQSLVAVGSHTGNKEIYLLDSDGHGRRAVTRNRAINLSPAWHPAGNQLAWTSYRRANPDLYIKELSAGRTRPLSEVRGVNTSPAFSPDGRTVAMSRTLDGDADVFLLDAAKGDVIRRLTTGGGIDGSPVFTPDGQSIVFASERSGGSQVYIVGVRGGAARRITFHGDFNTDPVVSPDGTRVAYVGRWAGGFDIYVADLDGGNVVRVTQDTGDNEDPTWTPDGRYLIFSSTRTGRSELWISTADGRHQTPITQGGGWTQPSFQPTVRSR